MRRFLLLLMPLLLFWSGWGLGAEAVSLNPELAPAEQYRRLSLVLLVGEGVDDVLLAALLQRAGSAPPADALDPDQLKSPLLRIVDQEGMLQRAAYLFRLARQHGAEVGLRMQELADAYPAVADGVSTVALREDAVLVRTAVFEALDYAGFDQASDLQSALAAYRERTVGLRDLLEFDQFEQELSRLTAQAIASVGSQLDAYQRMFEDETRDDTFDRHIRSAERPYAGRRPVDEQAAKVTEEIMEAVVLSESHPDP